MIERAAARAQIEGQAGRIGRVQLMGVAIERAPYSPQPLLLGGHTRGVQRHDSVEGGAHCCYLAGRLALSCRSGSASRHRQAAPDHVEELPLLGHEQHPLAVQHRLAQHVGDRLRLARARRPLQDERLASHRVGDRGQVTSAGTGHSAAAHRGRGARSAARGSAKSPVGFSTVPDEVVLRELLPALVQVLPQPELRELEDRQGCRLLDSVGQAGGADRQSHGAEAAPRSMPDASSTGSARSGIRSPWTWCSFPAGRSWARWTRPRRGRSGKAHLRLIGFSRIGIKINGSGGAGPHGSRSASRGEIGLLAPVSSTIVRACRQGCASGRVGRGWRHRNRGVGLEELGVRSSAELPAARDTRSRAPASLVYRRQRICRPPLTRSSTRRCSVRHSEAHPCRGVMLTSRLRRVRSAARSSTAERAVAQRDRLLTSGRGQPVRADHLGRAGQARRTRRR